MIAFAYVTRSLSCKHSRSLQQTVLTFFDMSPLLRLPFGVSVRYIVCVTSSFLQDRSACAYLTGTFSPSLQPGYEQTKVLVIIDLLDEDREVPQESLVIVVAKEIGVDTVTATRHESVSVLLRVQCFPDLLQD